MKMDRDPHHPILPFDFRGQAAMPGKAPKEMTHMSMYAMVSEDVRGTRLTPIFLQHLENSRDDQNN
jgi:hypothetical protein